MLLHRLPHCDKEQIIGVRMRTGQDDTFRIEDIDHRGQICPQMLTSIDEQATEICIALLHGTTDFIQRKVGWQRRIMS